GAGSCLARLLRNSTLLREGSLSGDGMSAHIGPQVFTPPALDVSDSHPVAKYCDIVYLHGFMAGEKLHHWFGHGRASEMGDDSRGTRKIGTATPHCTATTDPSVSREPDRTPIHVSRQAPGWVPPGAGVRGRVAVGSCATVPHPGSQDDEGDHEVRP